MGDELIQNRSSITMPSPPLSSHHPPRIWRKQLSKAIDASLLLEEKLRRSKESYNLKIILIGPKQCGKTTLLKGLRNCCAPKAFKVEADVWRPVIRLNLVRTMNFVTNLVLHSQPRRTTSDDRQSAPPILPSGLRQLAETVASVLREVEETLLNCIAPPEKILQAGWYPLNRVAEFSSGHTLIPFRREHMREEERRADQLLSACVHDMHALWTADMIQQILVEQNVALQNQPGFFLDDLRRICDAGYVPTTSKDDILRTRVHNPFIVCPGKHEIERESPFPWAFRSLTVYEMRSRCTISDRAPWAQFVDNVDCLIFLIPISAFDETHYENETGVEINRLEASLNHWRLLCSKKLLASVQFTVCLNKIDIFTRKIESGKQFSKYVTSYGRQPNDPEAIIEYICRKVQGIHKKSSPRGRNLHLHCICATDPTAVLSVMSGLRADITAKTLYQGHFL
ncbi:guanine nucleotide binding protein, alpha subunit [Favolaschia claudopus]|uniref:Guanine nucleotide binding protein, alpha subunit n=1 Tax=Favolaschia claudopus TaxID=2862362 RepID=A0AAV9ZXD3_9AGAR